MTGVREVDLASRLPAADFQASSVVLNDSVNTLLVAASSAVGILLGSVAKKQLFVVEALPLNKGDGRLPPVAEVTRELQNQITSIVPLCVGGLYPVGIFIVGDKDTVCELPYLSLVHTLYTSVNEAFPTDLMPLQRDVIVVQSYNKTKVDIDIYRSETSSSSTSTLSFSRMPITFTKRGMWGELVPVSTVITFPFPPLRPSTSVEDQQHALTERRQLIQQEALKQLSASRVRVAHVDMTPRPGMAIWPVETAKVEDKSSISTQDTSGTMISLELRAYIHCSSSITVAVRALIQDMYNTTHSLGTMSLPAHGDRNTSVKEDNKAITWTRAWISLSNNDAVTMGVLIGPVSADNGTTNPASAKENEDKEEAMEEEDMIDTGRGIRERHTTSRRGQNKKLDHFSSVTAVTTLSGNANAKPVLSVYPTVEAAEAAAKALMTTAAAITVDAGVQTMSSRYCSTHATLNDALKLQSLWREKRSADNTEIVESAIRRRNSICNKLCGDVNTAMTIAALLGFVFSHFVAQFIEIKFTE